ncbi:MAG: NA+/H+ antiporter (napA), putative [uncultured Sulfurovum sp.]|uniref:NA+/H+ antiporter (NapA), putative n=1 Tax=uncultured Sulfurovum sp. TaxID=269237 RepID=A0A6S6TDY5_9BACT|nr:MAG: NA+/H+ antiporter (napA), putative [uncultured Sulfurovum sp.]
MESEKIGIILAISLILVLSPHLSKFLRLPTAPIEIVLGSALAMFGIINIENEHFHFIAHVGFLYLMFLAGLEVNLKSIFKMPKVYTVQAFYFLATMWGLAVLLGWILDLPPVLIIILPLISIGILATLSKEYGKEAPWIKIAFLVGTIGEVLSIIALTVFEAYYSVNDIEELLSKLALLLGFLVAVWLLYIMFRTLFWWYPELKSTLMPSSKTVDGKYQDLRLSMGIFFIMVSIMLKLHLEVAFGAFIAGVFISTFFHHKKELEENISSFGFGFLVPIFFIYVGASLELKAIFIKDFFQEEIFITSITLLAGMFFIRIVAAFTLSFITGKREALLIAFALAMPLTLMIAIATIAYQNHGIQLFHYNAVVLVSLLEVIISMVVIKLLVKEKP